MLFFDAYISASWGAGAERCIRSAIFAAQQLGKVVSKSEN